VDCILVGLNAQDALNPFIVNRFVLDDMSLVINILFFIELLLRFYAYGVCESLRISAWIRFDTFFCSMSLLEIIFMFWNVDDKSSVQMGSVGALRLLRCLRLARAARLMVQFRTLWLLVCGLKSSVSTIGWAFILTGAISFIFAVIGMEIIPPRDLSATDVYDEISSRSFGNLGASMLTLLQVLTLDSVASVYRPLIEQGELKKGVFCTIYFIMYILIVSIALMNLITAVIVEGSVSQAAQDKEAMELFEKQRLKLLIPKLRGMFDTLDDDGSGYVSLEELNDASAELKGELRRVTKHDDLEEIFLLLDDDDSGTVGVDEFLQGIAKASSGNVLLNLQMSRMMKQLRKLTKVPATDETTLAKRRESTAVQCLDLMAI